MRIELPHATKVIALEPYRLRITWSAGETLDVDLSEKIKSIPAIHYVLEPEVFSTVHISGGGTSIEWRDCEFGADNVYAWTREQMGEASHEMFFEWMQRNGLSLRTAAEALGMSRRMVAYYRAGARPIPKTVWLACIGWEVTRKQHFAA